MSHREPAARTRATIATTTTGNIWPCPPVLVNSFWAAKEDVGTGVGRVVAAVVCELALSFWAPNEDVGTGVGRVVAAVVWGLASGGVFWGLSVGVAMEVGAVVVEAWVGAGIGGPCGPVTSKKSLPGPTPVVQGDTVGGEGVGVSTAEMVTGSEGSEGGEVRP
jgi:hypothetical protein